jgi:1-acyl-sn-glycerol-3-phosphate acyltransferase
MKNILFFFCMLCAVDIFVDTSLFVCVYGAGLFVGIVLFTLRLLRIWKVSGGKNLPTLAEKGDRGLIVVSNHPSLLEPIALIGLFAHWYVFNIKYGPWNMAEAGNFRRGLFRLLEQRIIFVDRKSEASKTAGYLRAKTLLKSGAILLIFPEGGRTYKGKVGEFVVAGNGSKVRPFTKGAASLALQTHAMVVPIWVEGTDKVSPNIATARYLFPRLWRPVKISIGKPIIFPENINVETATHELEKAVLAAGTNHRIN